MAPTPLAAQDHQSMAGGSQSGTWAIVCPIAFLLWAIVSCRGGTNSAGAVSVRDSAGVTIVEASADPRHTVKWSVQEPPQIIDDNDQLYRVRAAGQFADGGFVIAHEGLNELRFYSADGTLQRTVGRRGAGPLEFLSMDQLETVGDSVWLFDRRNARVTTIGRNGDLIRSISLVDLGRVEVLGVFSGGRFLISRAEKLPTGRMGVHETHRRYYITTGDGSLSHVGDFVITEGFTAPLEDGFVMMPIPFGRMAVTRARGNEWFYTPGDEYRIEEYDLAGRVHAIYIVPTQPRAVTVRDQQHHLARMRTEAKGQITRFEQITRTIPLPERMPAYTKLIIDPNGNLWAAVHGDEESPKCWHVHLAQTAHGFAEICLPNRFTLLDVRSASLIGTMRGELDVEHIARYRLAQ